jgi:hypothetical protein
VQELRPCPICGCLLSSLKLSNLCRKKRQKIDQELKAKLTKVESELERAYRPHVFVPCRGISSRGGVMASSLQQRIARLVDFVAQLNELDQLHERLNKAKQSGRKSRETGSRRRIPHQEPQMRAAKVKQPQL